jgi:zinc/manganese transport system ATP-binding protein
LLLDEPLANLDLGSEQGIVGLLTRIAREHGIAVLLSAHEMNPLLPTLDRIVYLAHGRAVHGSTDEVIRSEVLSRLYGHQVDVLRVRGRVLVVAGQRHDPLPDIPTSRHRRRRHTAPSAQPFDAGRFDRHRALRSQVWMSCGRLSRRASSPARPCRLR